MSSVILKPQIAENFIVPGVVIKSRTQDECYVVSILSSSIICLLPRDQAQKKYKVGDTLWGYIERIQGWKIMLSQKNVNYIKMILNGIFLLEGTISVKAIAHVKNTNFYKVSIEHNVLTQPSEIIFDAIRQTKKFIKNHIIDTVTFVPYDSNIEQYIINALAPGKSDDIKRIIFWDESNVADVFVEPHKKNVFLGTNGLNVATAAKLLGIQIKIL